MRIMPPAVTESEVRKQLTELNRRREEMRKMQDRNQQLWYFDTECQPLISWFRERDILLNIRKGQKYYLTEATMTRLGFGHRRMD